MEGTVKSFLPSKGYGFVRGDDGNDYYIHVRDMLEGQVPRQGLRVSFEEAVTPKGYRARRIRPMTITIAGRYVTPANIVETKGSEFSEWEVLESIPCYVIASSRDSPDAARAELRARARTVGANALMRVQYFKTKGNEGNYIFTIHNYRAVPATVGQITGGNGKTRDELVGLSRKADEIVRQQIERMSGRRRKGNWCSVCGLAATVACFVMLGPTVIALIPGVVMLLVARGFYKEEGSWLEPMM